MPKIWLCEARTDNSRDFLAAFDDELVALQEAGYLMAEDFINRDATWNMNDSHIAGVAFDIYTNIKLGTITTLRKALMDFNQHLSSGCSDVKEITVLYTLTYNKADGVENLDDSFFHVKSDEDEEEEEISEEEIKEDVAKAAEGTGATCIKCHVFNEYATPTTADNMYCCSQCKTFINVFSQEN
jgi:hypothetical protein